MKIDHKVLTILLGLWMMCHTMCTPAHGHDTHLTDVTPVPGSLIGTAFEATDGKLYNLYKGGDVNHYQLHVEGLIYDTDEDIRMDNADEDKYIYEPDHD